MTGSRAGRWLSRLALVALGAALVEAAFQVAALAAWGVRSFARPAAAPRAAPDSSVVLCVGDSYTFGFGATSIAASYPSQLEARLRRGGAAWTVVNGGLPGRNSFELAAGLGDQLERSGARTVYVLVGANDLWSRPRRIDAAESRTGSDTSFVWRWRLPRFLRLARRALFETAPQVAGGAKGGSSVRAGPKKVAGAPAPTPVPETVGELAPELVGAWSFGDDTLRFDADGGVDACGQSFRWETRGSELQLRRGSSPPLARLSWGVEGGVLSLRDPSRLRKIELRPARAARSTSCDEIRRALFLSPEVVEGVGAIWSGDLERAERLLVGILATPDGRDDPAVHGGLAKLYRRTARAAEAQAELDWLEREYERRGRPVGLGIELIQTAEDLGQMSPFMGRARELLERAPDEPWIWKAVAWESFQEGKLAEAAAAIDRAIALLPADPLPSSPRSFFLQLRGQILLGSDPRAAIRSGLESFALDPQEGSLSNLLVRAGKATVERELAVAEDEVGLDAATRAGVERARRAAFSPADEDVLETLAWNLSVAIARIRAAGAVPVLLTYPFHSPLEPTFRRVGAETGTDLLDVASELDRRTDGAHPRESWFVADGHLNDAGYGLVAELVAADALRRQPGQPGR